MNYPVPASKIPGSLIIKRCRMTVLSRGSGALWSMKLAKGRERKSEGQGAPSHTHPVGGTIPGVDHLEKNGLASASRKDARRKKNKREENGKNTINLVPR